MTLAGGYYPRHSVLGIIWDLGVAAVMFALAAGKAALAGRRVILSSGPRGRVTVIDGILAAAVLPGLVLNVFLSVVVCAAGLCPR